jgi:Tfp pilus assembly protein PilF/predicted Zn-dependent protease with MMP-like domain
MDQLSAHLDRGWDLLQKGDLRGARSSARRALQIEKDSPEAHNLLGFVAAQEGDADEALEHYRQAMALDDGYIDPMLNAAEVLIHPMREYEEAIALCDEVLEFAEGKEETADAVLLKFDALLASGNRDGAKAVLADLPEEQFEGPMYPFLIGRALFEAGEATKAEPHLRAAIEADTMNPDAHYYMGLVLDEKGESRAATLAFLESREIDMRADRPAWSPPRDAFQSAVEGALKQIDPQYVAMMDNALVLVSDVPGMEIVAEGVDPRLPVLLDGVTRSGESGPLAARVFVYLRNIERLCGGIEQLEEEIAFQLTEEIKHALEHRDRDDASRGADGKTAPRVTSSDVARAREAARSERTAEREKSPADGEEIKPPKRTRKA